MADQPSPPSPAPIWTCGLPCLALAILAGVSGALIWAVRYG